MTDMGVNHVQLENGETVVDLRGVTVNEDVLFEGYTAIDSKGNPVTGKASSQGGGGSAVTEIFYVPFKVGASGFVLDGVTYDDIVAAYNSGKFLVAQGYIPSAANVGVSGQVSIPMNNLLDNGRFVFSLVSANISATATIDSNGTVSVAIRRMQNEDKRVTSISGLSTDDEYPSAKAVYNYVQSNAGGGGGGSGENVSDVFYVDFVLDPQTFQTSGVSCTFEEALDALVGRYKIVKFRLVVTMGVNNLVFGDVVNYDAVGNNIVGGVTFRANFGQGLHVYHFVANFNDNNTIDVTPYIVNTTSMM